MSDGVFAALSHPTRRAVLALLRARGAVSVGEIAEELGVVGPTLSGHLKVLRTADLVATERRGTTIRYVARMSVLESALAEFLRSLGVGAEDGVPPGEDGVSRGERGQAGG